MAGGMRESWEKSENREVCCPPSEEKPACGCSARAHGSREPKSLSLNSLPNTERMQLKTHSEAEQTHPQISEYSLESIKEP